MALPTGIYRVQPVTNRGVLLHSWSESGRDGATLRVMQKDATHANNKFDILVTHCDGDRYFIQFAAFPDAHLIPDWNQVMGGGESLIFTRYKTNEWSITPAGPDVWRVGMPFGDGVWSADNAKSNDQVKARLSRGTPGELWVFTKVK